MCAATHCQVLHQRPLPRARQSLLLQVDLYLVPSSVDFFLFQGGEFEPPAGTSRQHLAAMLLMFGRGYSAMKWAHQELRLQPRWGVPPMGEPLPWYKLPFGVKQWAAAGLPGLQELEQPALNVLVGSMCRAAGYREAAMECFRWGKWYTEDVHSLCGAI